MVDYVCLNSCDRVDIYRRPLYVTKRYTHVQHPSTSFYNTALFRGEDELPVRRQIHSHQSR